ncbi:MAG: hypothetical protein SGJ18_01295 [Pseudomonadota bacterium]|nr:hypothetical protein [Pseudomonadota bacterium]
MNRIWQNFPTPPHLKDKLISKIKEKGEVFSFLEEPLYASLLTCLGLQFEMGNREWDRLSATMGIKLEDFPGNPWKSEIISLGQEIGIRLWIPDHLEFKPQHPDFSLILHPLSINEEGLLDQIVIFPNQVARRYAQRGLELVIVSKWALSSFLCSSQEHSINYLKTNKWEIENNYAFDQVQLLRKHQVAFFGTHDLADHLLGGQKEGFTKNQELYEEIQTKLFNPHLNRDSTKNLDLILRYFVGVLMDDLAQPVWYASQPHINLIEQSLRLFEKIGQTKRDSVQIELPQSFHNLIKILRSKLSHNVEVLNEHFKLFESDLLCQANC